MSEAVVISNLSGVLADTLAEQEFDSILVSVRDDLNSRDFTWMKPHVMAAIRRAALRGLELGIEAGQ